MSDPRNDQALERLLSELARGEAYPPSPDLWPRVRARIERTPGARRAEGRRWQMAAVAAGVLFAVAAVTVSVVEDARDAVADFLGLRVPGEEIHLLPTPQPGVTPSPFPTPAGLSSVATPVASGAVRDLVGFEPVYPPGAGEPRGVYVVDYLGSVRVVVLEYERFDLWEAREGVFEKGVFVKGAATFEETTVNGRPAYWIQGGEHIVRVRTADGREVVGSERTVSRNTLVWRGTLMNYRLEIEGALDDALRIATTLP